MMWLPLFFLVLIFSFLLLWMAVGSRLLIVDAVWVGAGVMMVVCGVMIMGGGNLITFLFGLSFVTSGTILTVATIKSYLQTQVRWVQEHRKHHKSDTIAALDRLQ